MAQTITFNAVRNNEDELVTIIFTCRVSSNFKTASSVIDAIKKALTNWVKNTEEGMESFERSCEDFNFADLSVECGEPSLQVFLENEGIFEISTQQVYNENVTNLDSVLINS